MVLDLTILLCAKVFLCRIVHAEDCCKQPLQAPEAHKCRKVRGHLDQGCQHPGTAVGSLIRSQKASLEYVLIRYEDICPSLPCKSMLSMCQRALGLMISSYFVVMQRRLQIAPKTISELRSLPLSLVAADLTPVFLLRTNSR